MKFKLKTTTAKKKREQLYLSLFFAFVIWVLFAVLFYSDANPQVLVIFLACSVLGIPWAYYKKVRPYFKNLTANVNEAYFEFVDDHIIFHHFDNLKSFNRQTMEFDVADIVNMKKAFRKDDTVNKITLTLKDKSKVVVEDFENMAELVSTLVEKNERQQKQASV